MEAHVLSANSNEIIMNQEFAGRFGKYILAGNNLWEGMDAQVRFRGHDSSIEHFLIQKGLLER